MGRARPRTLGTRGRRGGAPRQPGRTPANERLLDTRGQARDINARNVINARRTNKAEARIAKWSVELMGETLTYARRKATKSQILADFVAEWTDTQLPPPQIQAECWTLYFDGSVMKTGAGAGLLFVSPLGEHMRYDVRLHFPASNNMAEYEALLCGLKIAIEIGVKCLDVRGDS
jgi:hypothetical protein